MNLVDKFSEYFDTSPVPDPESEDFLMYRVTEENLTLEVSVNEAESLVLINIHAPSRELPVFISLQRNIGEVTIKTDSRGHYFLWFRSECNAVFIFKSPILVNFKG